MKLLKLLFQIFFLILITTACHDTSIPGLKKKTTSSSSGSTPTPPAPPATPATPASVVLSLTGQTDIIANGSSTTTFQALVKDASGNPLSNISTTLNIPTNGGSVFTNPVITNASGIANFTLSSSTVIGTYAYTATVSGSLNSSSVNVNFVASGAAAQVVLAVTGATTITADGVSTTTLEATVKDATGNPVSGESVTLTLPTNGGSVVTNPVTSDANGIASFTLTSSTTVGTYGYTASVAGPINSSSVNVDFVSGAATQVTLAITGLSTIVADGTSTTTLEATVTDGAGNPVSGESVTLTLPTNGGSVVTNPVTSDANGVVSFILTSSTLAGNYSYYATIAAGTISSGVQNLDFIAGIAAQVTLAVTGATAINADGTSTTTLQATVTDANGNVVQGENTNLAIPANGGSVLTNPVATDVNGLASFTLTSSTTVGTYNYTASVAGPISSTGVSIDFVGQTLTQISLSITGSNVIETGGATSTTLVATAYDSLSNPMPGISLSLTLPGGSGLITDGPFTTDVNGQVSFSVSAGTKDGLFALAATDGTLSSGNVTLTVLIPGDTTLEFDQEGLDFGLQASPADLPVVITNTGTNTSGSINFTVSGNKFSLFFDDCTGQTLAPGATCNITVRFTPGGGQANQSGSVTMKTGSGGSASTKDILTLAGQQ